MSSLLAAVVRHYEHCSLSTAIHTAVARTLQPSVRPHVDLLLECAEWLAGVQTDKLGLPVGLYGTGKRVRK